jgi:CelD/BcsL family acetyltransferase involved in cellulose biosynthesis
MILDVVRTAAAFEALAPEWNTLLSHSAIHVPFLRHEFLFPWWQTLGGGEWSHGDLYVVTARQVGGELIAAAPLFFTENLEGEPALMLLGSIEIADYLDVIAQPDHSSTFIESLLEYLVRPDAPEWRCLDWYNLFEYSPTLPILTAAAERRGWKVTRELLQHCPYIPLPGDWDVYLSGIDKKQRHEIRRKIRRAESAEVPVSWYIVSDESKLDAEIDIFLALMSQDLDKDRFLTDIMRTHMRKSVHAAFQAGWLQLAFMQVGDKKVAGYLNFDYDNHIWVYNSGLDYNYRELSPGWVLLGYLLQWANEHQRKAFDFMRGDEDYKYRFGAIDRRLTRIKVTR